MSAPRSSRRIIEALLVLVLLSAIVWVVNLRRQRPKPSAPAAVNLTPGAGEPVRGSLIVGTDTLLFDARADEHWLRGPLGDRLDPMYVVELVRQAETLRPLRVLPDTAGESFGLHPPHGSVRLGFASGEEWGIEIGDEVPAGGQRYARTIRPGSSVFLLDGYAATTYFLPSLDKVRDRVAASLRTGPPDSIAVLVPGREVRARRQSKDLWRTTRPAGLSVDPARINAVVQLLRGPNIQGFVPPDSSAESLGLATPRAIWVLCQGARRESVRIGRSTADGSGVYIRPAGRPGFAILSAEQFRSLVDGWPALADRRLLSLARDSVDSITFPGLATAGYRRREGAWLRASAEKPVTRPEALRTDLANLLLLQWQQWPLTPVHPPADAERLRLVLSTPARAETLELAANRAGGAWARSSVRHMWGVIPETPWTIWSYRARHPE
jgi:hypothetical protein